jgi:hypothetical protein
VVRGCGVDTPVSGQLLVVGVRENDNKTQVTIEREEFL